ncbi:SUN domain-containing protein 1-like [Larimichthys crocea]|uniref:SUN domain-containing protein 1-like n=1 Tax=Larimichthys crocea TaxID=215358 RepID=UPI000F5EFE6F|nr:SUN domain-containing protein 1-like [Larimichthys crocea]
MLRRSVRLQEGKEGTPAVSYKEILYRVFQRRRRLDQNLKRRVSMDHIQTCIPADSQTPYEEQTGTNRGGASFKMTVRTMTNVLILLLLAFGIAQISELQKEVKSLRAQIITLAPLADTMPNFALKSQGAEVWQSLSSNTYWPREHIIGMMWDKLLYWWYSTKAQQGVIQGHSRLLTGQCWPFAGERGHLFVSLSHPISITRVTLGHIVKSQSPHGNIESAPREFSVYGMTTTGEAGTHLGRLVYDRDGAAFQTFHLPNPERRIFRYVRLEIENNWGNIDYTCIYSFRVYGKLPTY